jgi:hypothetical protein
VEKINAGGGLEREKILCPLSFLFVIIFQPLEFIAACNSTSSQRISLPSEVIMAK